MPSLPTPPRRRPSSSAGSPQTMMAGWPRSSACCKACRRAPRSWKGRPMASHEDLDLIRLFGLSAEEASGLGLDPSVQPPRPAPSERRSAARGPAPVAPRRSGAHAEPVAPEGAPGIVVPERATRESELALLAMFENPTAQAPDDSGRGARSGLALADAVTPPGRQALEGGVGKAEADMFPPPPPHAAAEAPDSGDAERFIWPADRLADEDDTVDVVSLFDLTAEEATSLGLTLRAAPAAGQGRASGASAVPRPQDAASPLRTMHLRAIDQDQRDERATGTPEGASAGGDGADGASGHGAGGAGPARPGAAADDEGLKDMLVNVVAASGTAKG